MDNYRFPLLALVQSPRSCVDLIEPDRVKFIPSPLVRQLAGVAPFPVLFLTPLLGRICVVAGDVEL